MKQRVLMLMLVLFATPAVLAGTYKWVDENGKVHYSDKPVEGAEEVRLPELPTYKAKTVPQATDDAAQAGPVEDSAKEPVQDAGGYQAFHFVSPQSEQVFWNIGGNLPVQLQLQPALRNGHRVKVFVNGELKAGPTQSLGYTLPGMIRGTHTIRAVVEDRSGQAVATAGPVTFFIKQSALGEQGINRPRNRPPTNGGQATPD